MHLPDRHSGCGQTASEEIAAARCPHGHRPGRLLPIALATLLALSACGSGGSGRDTDDFTPGRPVPEEPPPPEAASACLNPARYTKAGTVTRTLYRETGDGIERSAEQTQTVEGPARLAGQPATRIAVSERTTSPGQPDETFTGAYYLMLADQVVRMVGTTSLFDHAGQQVGQTIALDPPQPDLDFSLAQGAASTSSGTATISLDPAPAPATRSPVSMTLRFDGFESVTVPAGSFTNACKFTLALTIDATTVTSTRWLARGSGIVLRTEAGNTSQALVSASIDGVPLAP